MNTLPTDEQYKAALLQSRQAAKFVNPTMGGSCADCLGTVCPDINSKKQDCWVDIVTKPAKCKCFDIATPPSLPWIRRKEGTREIALQIARANLTPPPTTQFQAPPAPLNCCKGDKCNVRQGFKCYIHTTTGVCQCAHQSAPPDPNWKEYKSSIPPTTPTYPMY